ncbi:hypothetical protein BDV25DRAFT_135722 [Aspergillus avenaceus]|uniref:Uncharacterized protein n=1 Tax=Aspergillus avenaceus TaxID=36643 RepID=A0A5N6U7H6_ASPAV|nr:hypothetical protein BDV25DRAFT_135722 [Aspergillus avenaceus]
MRPITALRTWLAQGALTKVAIIAILLPICFANTLTQDDHAGTLVLRGNTPSKPTNSPVPDDDDYFRGAIHPSKYVRGENDIIRWAMSRGRFRASFTAHMYRSEDPALLPTVESVCQFLSVLQRRGNTFTAPGGSPDLNDDHYTVLQVDFELEGMWTEERLLEHLARKARGLYSAIVSKRTEGSEKLESNQWGPSDDWLSSQETKWAQQMVDKRLASFRELDLKVRVVDRTDPQRDSDEF